MILSSSYFDLASYVVHRNRMLVTCTPLNKIIM